MANKKLWLGMLVTVLAFGMALAGCDNGSSGGGGGGSGGNGDLLEFSLVANPSEVRVKYEGVNYGGITYNGDHDLGGAIPDFKIAIDGADVAIAALSGGLGALDFSIGGTYAAGDKHTVKVVYTADPSRKIIGKGYKSEDVVVSSFVEERELTVIPYLGYTE